MTDAQREAAARELCRLRGVNPDGEVREHYLDHEKLEDCVRVHVAWKWYLQEIIVREQVDAAMRAGMEAQEP